MGGQSSILSDGSIFYVLTDLRTEYTLSITSSLDLHELTTQRLLKSCEQFYLYIYVSISTYPSIYLSLSSRSAETWQLKVLPERTWCSLGVRDTSGWESVCPPTDDATATPSFICILKELENRWGL